MAKSNSMKKWRERYSKASSRLRSQISKLEQRYPESVALEQGRREDWGGVRTLPKDYSLKELQRLTRYAEKTLKSGLYSLQRHRRTYANASLTLKEKGINVDRKNIGSYFRFLDDLQARGMHQILYNRSADLFNRAKKQGLSAKDLRENVKIWANEYEDRIKKGSSDRWRPTLKNTGSDSFGN